MADENVIDDELDVEGQAPEEEIVFTNGDDAAKVSTEELAKDLEGLKTRTTGIVDTVSLTESLNAGFAKLGENLNQAIVGKNQVPVQEEIDPLDALTDDEISQMALTDGKKFTAIIRQSTQQQIQRAISRVQTNFGQAQTQSALALKETDPDIGTYVKEYRKEIEGVMDGFDANTKSHPNAVQFAVDVVLGRHAKDILSKAGSVSRPNPPAPNVAKGGVSTGTSTKRTVDLSKHFSAQKIHEMRNVHGMTDADIALLIK